MKTLVAVLLCFGLPILAGAIVGEHTYNVDGLDSLQGYYVKAAQYAEIVKRRAAR